MTVQWLEDKVGTVPLRAFRVAPHQAYPFEAGPFRVPPSEGPDTPYADECDTVGSGWLKQNVGQFSARAQPIQRMHRQVTGTGGCPYGYVRHGDECICDAYANTPCDRVPPPKPTPSGSVSPRRGRMSARNVSWMAGNNTVGQEEFKAGPVTTVKKEDDDKTEYIKLAVVGAAGVIVGALLF